MAKAYNSRVQISSYLRDKLWIIAFHIIASPSLRILKIFLQNINKKDVEQKGQQRTIMIALTKSDLIL